ncbi:MAG: PHB depolymerase family esterase [Rhodospirillales bacterium]|nr:PHB depolymerase family esterase [Rhodospirillales bacterium]
MALAIVLAAPRAGGAVEPPQVEPLPALAIEAGSITLSGVSSGANIAHQVHVAHSARVSGIGLLAASPYHCAGSGYPFNLLRTTNTCMDAPDLVPFLGPPDLEASVESTEEEARRGRIDDPSNLRDDRVWIFAGRRDEQVPASVAAVVERYYERFAGADGVTMVSDVDAGHAMVTEGVGNACATSKAPFINDCGFDAAGALLAHLYGRLKPPAGSGGRIVRFDQTVFAPNAEQNGLAVGGYLFVPDACAGDDPCRLHVVFHGCQQSAETIGLEFVEGAGYNRWAAANRIVVLYPQAAALRDRFLWVLPLPWPNPLGCWDWWGFTGADFHVKSGPQIRAVEAMIALLAGGKAAGR